MVTENSPSKAIFSNSQNHVSLQFNVENSYSLLILVTSVVFREITLKMAGFSLKIMIYGENCNSQISRYTQMVRINITFELDHNLSLILI